jgi:AraC-like DNA-binding protein/predicted enzyme related to lactoylglutathione lyase
LSEWRDAIERAIYWIEGNLTHEFGMVDLANQAGYSPFYFSRLFHLIAGITMKKYIADRRLCRAAYEIKDTDTRIIDIAVKYGFSSQAALTRALKSAYGHTPYAFGKNPQLIVLPALSVDLPLENNIVKGEKFMTDRNHKGKKIMSDFTKTAGFSQKLVSINIVTSDPKRLAEFYKNILGADINEEYGGPHRIEIWFGKRNESTVCIVANHDEGFKPQTYNACQGFEFRVADADIEYKRIRALGVEVKDPPKDLPWGVRYFNIKDPDGNGIDIVASTR